VVLRRAALYALLTAAPAADVVSAFESPIERAVLLRDVLELQQETPGKVSSTHLHERDMQLSLRLHDPQMVSHPVALCN
jgi:hypothetical protein